MAVTIERTKGTTLKVTITATLTLVPQLSNLKPTGYSQDTMDVTTLDSTVMEQDATIAGAAQITADVIFNPANTVHQFLHTQSALQTSFACELIFPTGTKQQFTAFVASFEFQQGSVKDHWKRTLVLQPIGAITIA